jgi:hypothetical protein
LENDRKTYFGSVSLIVTAQLASAENYLGATAARKTPSCAKSTIVATRTGKGARDQWSLILLSKDSSM